MIDLLTRVGEMLIAGFLFDCQVVMSCRENNLFILLKLFGNVKMVAVNCSIIQTIKSFNHDESSNISRFPPSI